MATERYRKFIRESEAKPEYAAAAVIYDFTEDVWSLMEMQGLSRSELAARLNASPAYVTKILRGNANFTLVSMAKLAAALGAELRVHLAERGARAGWRDVASAEPKSEEGPPSFEAACTFRPVRGKADADAPAAA